MQETKDLIFYLQEMSKLTEKLSPEQKKQYNEVMKSILILLIAFKRNSHLGETHYPFLDKFFK